jgi:pyruvate formate lyase activating enzyme
VRVCPTSAQTIINYKHAVNFDLCEVHAECVKVCQNEALSIIGSDKNVEEIIGVVLRDKDYYANSGGGITISGGEPMTQFEFTKEILKAARANSIHTCIETCGHAPTERYLEIGGLVDLFLFDYKESDTARHKDFTGATNDLILKNLSALYESGANIILRCPLIPGVNDTPGHLLGIAEINRGFPSLRGIEIMSYHNIGIDKAKRIGREISFSWRQQEPRKRMSG